MGTGASVHDAHHLSHSLKRSDADIVRLMLPVYYTLEDVSNEDLVLAKLAWGQIIDDTLPNYLSLKANKLIQDTSCVMFFYDTFYHRLFDVHPMCRSMFKSGLKTQGKFLVKMISLCLSEINSDPQKFNQTLVNLTEVHNTRGVKSIEYGIIGEVMFFTLQRVLGDGMFNNAMRMAWIRIFSRMLTIMVPIAVAFEIKTGGAAQKTRIFNENEIQTDMFTINSAPTSVQNSKSNSRPSSPSGRTEQPSVTYK